MLNLLFAFLIRLYVNNEELKIFLDDVGQFTQFTQMCEIVWSNNFDGCYVL